jgi:hypothetical protein
MGQFLTIRQKKLKEHQSLWCDKQHWDWRSRRLSNTNVTQFMAKYSPKGWAGWRSRYSDWLRAIKTQWGARFSASIQTSPGVHPAPYTMGTGSFPGVKSDRGETLIPHPLLALWSWKGRAIPLLPLWVIQPGQSLSACTRVDFYFILPKTADKCGLFYNILHDTTNTFRVATSRGTNVNRERITVIACVHLDGIMKFQLLVINK